MSPAGAVREALRKLRPVGWAWLLLAACACAAAPGESEHEALLEQADRALAEGRLPDAEASFARVHRAFPQDARAAFGLGLALLRQGEAARAVPAFEAAARLEPGNVEHAYLRALALDAAGRNAEALEQLEKLVADEPAHQGAALARIDALEKAGRLTDAAEAAARAAGHWPRDARVTFKAAGVSLRAGRPGDALRSFEMARRARSWDPEAVAGLIASLEALGRRDDARLLAPMHEELLRRQSAIQDLMREAASAPGDAALAGRLAQRLFEEGRLEDFLSATDSYLKRFPQEDFGGSLAVRAAQAAALLGDAPTARRFLEAAGRGSRSAAEKVATAEVLVTLGEHEEALAAFGALLQSDPDNPGAVLGLGRMAMRTDRLDQAEPALRRAVDLSPRSAAAHAALGLLLIKKEDEAGARAALERAIALDDALPDALFGLGFLAHRQRRLPEAERLLRRAVDLQPLHATARAVLAIVLSDQGRCDEAIPLFMRGLEEDYRNLALHTGLIRCLEDSGRPAEAEAARAIAREIQGFAP